MGGALPERAMGQKSGMNPITNKPLVRSLKQFILQMIENFISFFFLKKKSYVEFHEKRSLE